MSYVCAQLTPEVSKIRNVYPTTEQFLEGVAQEVGWVGWSAIGGLDESGRIKQVRYAILSRI